MTDNSKKTNCMLLFNQPSNPTVVGCGKHGYFIPSANDNVSDYKCPDCQKNEQ